MAIQLDFYVYCSFISVDPEAAAAAAGYNWRGHEISTLEYDRVGLNPRMTIGEDRDKWGL